MLQPEMIKQVIEFNRTAFESTFKAMSMVQDQTEEMLLAYMEKSPWIPSEGKKVLMEWLEKCKKSREEYKKIVDDGFKRMENIFSKTEKKAKKSSEAKTK